MKILPDPGSAVSDSRDFLAARIIIEFLARYEVRIPINVEDSHGYLTGVTGGMVRQYAIGRITVNLPWPVKGHRYGMLYNYT